MTVAQPNSSTRSLQSSDPCYDWRQSFVFNGLRTLFLSCRSFWHSTRLFSIACALFDKNTVGGIPLPALHGSRVTSHRSRPSSCAQTQKCAPVSPSPATLTHSLLRKSFPCHSYANSGDGCATPPKILPPSPALTTFRINTCISVASKRLYLPLESTLMKKQGEGGGGLLTSIRTSAKPRRPLRLRVIVSSDSLWVSRR